MPPAEIFYMILQLIHLIFFSLLQNVPKNFSNFANLPEDVLTIIFSYHDKFPILSQVNRHFRTSYEKYRDKFIRYRLDGFDPGDEYKTIGNLITLNYENANDPKILRQRIEYVYETDSSIDVRFNLLAHHALKRFSAIVISNSFGFSSFALAVMRIVIKEDLFKEFKILFQFCYSIRRDFPL